MRKGKSWIWFYCLTIAAVLWAADWGSRAVTVVAENTPIARSHCIIIDAGHGGEDGGAVSCTGIAESQYNLDISLRLNDLFHFLGYETKMIRTTDTAIYTSGKTLSQKKISDLKERVRIANETEHAIYLSIHQNNFTDSQYRGAQVFYPSEGFSRDLASRLQENFRACLNPESHRTIKKSKGVYLMEHIQCPGVLIECGFLSNPQEEAMLRDPEYQKKLCSIIAASISSCLMET